MGCIHQECLPLEKTMLAGTMTFINKTRCLRNRTRGGETVQGQHEKGIKTIGRNIFIFLTSAWSCTVSKFSGAAKREGAQTPKWPHSALLLHTLRQLDSDKPLAAKTPAQTFSLLLGSNFQGNLKHTFSSSYKRQPKDLCQCFPTGTRGKVWKSQY